MTSRSSIARKARERDTGARALRSIVEEVMTEIMFELPEMEQKEKFLVTEDVIRDDVLPIGLVDVKVAAVSEIWSGLKLVIRKELR